MTAITTKNAPGACCNRPEGNDNNPNPHEGADVMTSLFPATHETHPDTPPWADGCDIWNEGTVDEYRCWWTLSVPVEGTRTYEHMEQRTAKVLVEQTHTAGQSPLHRGPFVVLEIDTDSANRALLTPAVARRLALQLLHHAELLTEEAGR